MLTVVSNNCSITKKMSSHHQTGNEEFMIFQHNFVSVQFLFTYSKY